MRISTNWNQQLGVNAMLDQQAKVSETQMKLSTGKRILTPSEDPAAAVRLIDLEQVTKQTDQYQANIVMARQRLSLEEANVQDVVDVLYRVKELTIQGMNDSNTQSDRAAIAAELDQLNEHLLGIANTKNANGEYIFAGYKTGTQPYTKGIDFNPLDFPIVPTPAIPPLSLSLTGVSSYPYYGDQSQRNIQIGPTRQVADGNYGEQVFGTSDVTPASTLPTTTEVPSNLFEIISKISALLKADAPKDIVAQPASGVNSTALDVGLQELDDKLDSIVSVQTTIGARMHALDRQESINADYILDMQRITSETGDLDYAEAISKFNLQNIALQAAQQAYTKVQNLSLFNYMR